jgi:hypothetical protein
MKKYITLEDLKDFEVWKSWRNGGLELEPLYNENEVNDLYLSKKSDFESIDPNQVGDL